MIGEGYDKLEDDLETHGIELLQCKPTRGLELNSDPSSLIEKSDEAR